MLRLVSRWVEELARPVLAAENDGVARPVGDPLDELADVAELIRRFPRAQTLTEAVEAAGGVARGEAAEGELCVPVVCDEVWAAGVTYERSRVAREHESHDGDLYARVYAASRPELFLKATRHRIVAPGSPMGLREDSHWHVPEAELGLVLGPAGAIIGYTLGNDLSCRDIEGENPLYLPQAKIFAGCVSLGPAVVPAEAISDPYALEIRLTIERAGTVIFGSAFELSRLHRRLEHLVEALRRSNPIPPGTVLLTGTGIVPPDQFALKPGDRVRIAAEPIGELENTVQSASDLPTPVGWSPPSKLPRT